ncbi:hypothetical protein C8R44DRAFT_734840 [Mycena epipterygia]|nr:hypothetical protein C8R44DRAFT_734840 [Mycena epipterygia]
MITDLAWLLILLWLSCHVACLKLRLISGCREFEPPVTAVLTHLGLGHIALRQAIFAVVPQLEILLLFGAEEPCTTLFSEEFMLHDHRMVLIGPSHVEGFKLHIGTHSLGVLWTQVILSLGLDDPEDPAIEAALNFAGGPDVCAEGSGDSDVWLLDFNEATHIELPSSGDLEWTIFQ